MASRAWATRPLQSTSTRQVWHCRGVVYGSFPGAVASAYRFVHYHDIVPHLPPYDFDFYHVPTEVWQFVFPYANTVFMRPAVLSTTLTFADEHQAVRPQRRGPVVLRLCGSPRVLGGEPPLGCLMRSTTAPLAHILSLVCPSEAPPVRPTPPTTIFDRVALALHAHKASPDGPLLNVICYRCRRHVQRLSLLGVKNTRSRCSVQTCNTNTGGTSRAYTPLAAREMRLPRWNWAAGSSDS